MTTTTITETCLACGGTGGELVRHDMHPRKDDGIIPLRSEWVGCVACHQTGRIKPKVVDAHTMYMRATFDGLPFPTEPIHIPTRKQAVPGGSR